MLSRKPSTSLSSVGADVPNKFRQCLMLSRLSLSLFGDLVDGR
jgi:hypothetical protein